MLTQLGLFLLSAATLAFEINLTRLFSVTQFYHFAFMIVSLALLGFGASGSALALFPNWGRRRPERTLGWLALGFAASSFGAFLLINRLPFDSFSITWERRQVGVLALHYVALAAPFFCSGAAVSLLLTIRPGIASRTYFVNLIGSATGCLLTFVASGTLGGEGIVVLSSATAAIAALLFHSSNPRSLSCLLSPALLICLLTVWFLQPNVLTLHVSPYKDLSYALNVPGAEVLSRRWNAFSRVDLVDSPAIRSLPGLSYRFSSLPPRQRGLTIDGSDLSGVVVDLEDLGFAGYLPGALAYRLRPSADALVLEPHGGLDIVVAHALSAQAITAVAPNPLVVDAARSIYRLPEVQTVGATGRSFARQTSQRADRRYDIVTLSLTAPYRSVRSGAYSLAEDYRYTVEAFVDYLALLRPGGVFQATRWLQTPPSEETRLFALTVTALEKHNVDPASAMLYFRGYNTATVLVSPDGFSPSEAKAARDWLSERAFDLVYAPEIKSDEVNQHNVLPSPDYYTAAHGLLSARDRAAWYDAFAFEITPPTDDHPFFGHYFKWRQAGQVLQEVGQTWQPFGGAGYFVLLAVLVLAVAAALIIILLPLIAGWLVGRLRHTRDPRASRETAPTLIYFCLIGLGFLFVEIPLVQRFILFLGQPVYGLTVVLFALLFFSGLGSRASDRLPNQRALATLVVLALIYPFLLTRLFDLFLGGAFGTRLLISVITLAPLGFLLGIPLPRGIAWLTRRAPDLIPWAWGVNGAASVVASVGAALLALSFGFSRVLIAGALCYAGALAVFASQQRRSGREVHNS